MGHSRAQAGALEHSGWPCAPERREWQQAEGKARPPERPDLVPVTAFIPSGQIRGPNAPTPYPTPAMGEIAPPIWAEPLASPNPTREHGYWLGGHWTSWVQPLAQPLELYDSGPQRRDQRTCAGLSQQAQGSRAKLHHYLCGQGWPWLRRGILSSPLPVRSAAAQLLGVELALWSPHSE